ncbi:MAG: B12-binding domain-containing protein [Alphaproteobacteria bacterium]|uniref:B12-binding domain-containing protein n=1 Tax=Candidatus Nitrobium versatile TaxID=2884831 RepID=A0A953SHF5_9BACT|nr:B12-binding domain-containing protein [Candidatus Nitrobium versatile]
MDMETIAQALLKMDEKTARESTQDALARGVPAKDIVIEGLSRGMEMVGERYAKKEYFVPDMLKASRIFNDILKEIEPLIRKETSVPIVRGAIGLVKGNTQDNGKNIVRIMLEANGIAAEDLGRSVPCEKFVEAARSADFLGLSVMTSSGVTEAGKVVRALEEQGLRDRVKVIAGGAAVNAEKAITAIGADAYASDAIQAVTIIKQWFYTPER